MYNSELGFVISSCLAEYDCNVKKRMPYPAVPDSKPTGPYLGCQMFADL